MKRASFIAKGLGRSFIAKGLSGSFLKKAVKAGVHAYTGNPVGAVNALLG